MRCVISCPIFTYSGYGARSRDFVRSLISVRPDWNIEILPQRWGDTRQDYADNNSDCEIFQSRIISEVGAKPDVWIQITVPNEFQPVGSYSIGVTAGMETNICDSSWIEGCNRMDMVIVSSQHSKSSLTGTSYRDNTAGRELKVNVPVEVLFEGFNADVYKSVSSHILDSLDSSWNYLCVGSWLPGEFGQDRKNISYTVKAFLETFKDAEGEVPGLILKTSECTSSISDKYRVLDKLYTLRESVSHKKSLPKLYLLHGDMTDSEMNELYSSDKVKAMVSFTKGEGFGRPLLEFARTGKPVICSGWSGPLDFLNPDYSPLVGGKLTKVHSSSVRPGMIIPEASWFTPEDRDVYAALLDVHSRYDYWKDLAEKQAEKIQTEFSLDKMREKLGEILSKYGR